MKIWNTFFKTTLTLILIELLFVNCQKFREDYMWAQAFRTFYRLHNIAMNWDKARQICEAEGTSLFVPSSLDELENMKILISNMKAHFTAIYTGLHDKFSKGEFVTIKGERICNTNLELYWDQGRPNFANDTERCVIMTREGLFDDRSCDDAYPFICKILVDHIVINDDCDNFDMTYHLNKNTSKCYKYHKIPLSWHDAYLTCVSEEAQLAIINSEEEAKILTNLLANVTKSTAPDSDILLIGFSDLIFPYHYRTIKGDTLKQAGYDKWAYNNELPSELQHKRCGAINRSGHLLMVNCEQPAMFICEKPLNNDSPGTRTKNETAPETLP